MEEIKPTDGKELPKRCRFYNWVVRHRGTIAGSICAVGGCVIGALAAKTKSSQDYADGIKAAYDGCYSADDVIITDTHDIEHEGKVYKGFSILAVDDKDT